MIVSVSILGCPTKLEEINKICKKFNLLHFEDNCESLGAKIKNRKTGTCGDISTHRFLLLPSHKHYGRGDAFYGQF